MKTFSITTLGLGLITLGLIGLLSCNDTEPEQPNFLIFLIDDLGSQDVGCYGQEYIKTPNIDRLAEQGMKWANAYSSNACGLTNR